MAICCTVHKRSEASGTSRFIIYLDKCDDNHVQRHETSRHGKSKQRNELLKKVRLFDNVQCAWIIDGRIVCLLADGKKVAIQTGRDVLAGYKTGCR